MIRTGVSFSTTDRKLQHLYDSAKDTLFASVKDFGNRKILTDAPNCDTATLNYTPMVAQTLADYDADIAMDSVRAFLVTLRRDGRMPCSLTAHGNNIIPNYDILTGFCFAEEAVKLCHLVKNKHSSYAKRLYEALCQFDEYLWTRHDLNANGCLEIFEEKDSEEGVGAARFMPITMMISGAERSVSPFPVEPFDLMGEAYSIRLALSELADMLGDKEQAEAWRAKAMAVAEKVRGYLWLGSFNACFDRDYRGSIISTMTVNNLYLLYYGVATPMMADAIMKHHIMNPKEFWTPMPLPSVARSHSAYDGENDNPFRGHPRATTYRRALRAFEKYRYFSATTALGEKLLEKVTAGCVFPTAFDTVTGEPLYTDKQDRYAPTASAVLEFIKRFYGVYADRDNICFGCLGHGNETSEYSFTWGNDVYRTLTEGNTITADINGKRLFTITAGTRVFTDIYGMSMRVANVTSEPIDCICVTRNQTYSLRLEPNEIAQLK